MTREFGIRIHQPFLRTFFVLFCRFFLYLEAAECNTTSDWLNPQKVCHIPIFKSWRKRQRMLLRMVCEYGPGSGWLVISVYLSSLRVAHLSDAPRRRLVVTGDSARIQDETFESSAWFFKVQFQPR